MSSNLIKRNTAVVKKEESRIIHSNELLEKKLQQIREIMEQEEVKEAAAMQEDFAEGLDAQQVEALLSDQAQEQEQSAAAGAEALAEAHAQIEEMMLQAQAEAEDIKQNAYEEGYESGHRDGLTAGQAQARKEAEAVRKKLSDQEAGMKRYYTDKIEELEPMFIDTLTGIYEHIFHIELTTFQPVIAALIGDIILQSDGNKDFIIRVSPSDYALVSAQKEQLRGNTSDNATIEIIKDTTLMDGTCLVETGGGIFDCGIDTQLAQLAKELKLLSYSGKDK